MCLGGKKAVEECRGVPLTMSWDSTEDGNGLAKLSGFIGKLQLN